MFLKFVVLAFGLFLALSEKIIGGKWCSCKLAAKGLGVGEAPFQRRELDLFAFEGGKDGASASYAKPVSQLTRQNHPAIGSDFDANC